MRSMPHHEQGIDTLRGKPHLQVGTKEHAGTMRDDERFSGLLAEFRRDLVVDEKTKLLDSLPVPVQRTDFRIAWTKPGRFVLEQLPESAGHTVRISGAFHALLRVC